MIRPPTVLLFSAGLATRLGPMRQSHAKACVPVAGTTPLRFLLRRLAAAGVRRAWVNLHHRAAEVRAEAETWAPDGVELLFLEEPRLLGTGGTLLAVAERDGDLPDLAVNAKIFTGFDFRAALAAEPGTLVLHAAGDLSLFGGLRHEGGGWITGLRRAGPPSREPGVAVFTGISRPAADWLAPLRAAAAARPAEPLCLVRDGLLPALEAGGRARSLFHDGLWIEVSTPERVAEADALLRSQPVAV